MNADRLASADLALGLRSLSELLAAGVPLRRSLVAFEAMAPDGWDPVHAPLQRAIREGRGLAAGLEESGQHFPPVVLGIVRSGESGAGLADAVRVAAEHAERSATAEEALRAALAYPAVVAIAGFATAGFIGGVILPRFATLLAGTEAGLPWSTRAVLTLSSGARAYWLPASLVAIVVVAIIGRLHSSPEGRRTLHRVLLRTPVIGVARHAAATSRFCGALSALLGGGMTLRRAIPEAASAAGDTELEVRIREARERIAQGAGIARAFASSSALTTTALKLIAAGEESGRLVELLQHASRVESARSLRLVQGAIRLVEPGLIILLALAVGFVAIAMLQAVYAIRPT